MKQWEKWAQSRADAWLRELSEEPLRDIIFERPSRYQLGFLWGVALRAELRTVPRCGLCRTYAKAKAKEQEQDPTVFNTEGWAWDMRKAMHVCRLCRVALMASFE